MKLVYIAIAANIVAFVQMAIDKRLAMKKRGRISEAQLLAPTLFGGMAGLLLGMIVFRHKTVKKSFQIKLFIVFVAFLAIVHQMLGNG